MKLLLDTHVWLWSILTPERLSHRTRDVLASREHELWLSPISIWETLLLTERGRLKLDAEPHGWIREAQNAVPILEAPLTFHVALASRSISLQHHDPADRFIAATAKVYNLTLATADRRLSECPDIEIFQ